MPTTTKGRTLLSELYGAGFHCEWQQSADYAYTLSLIARHAKTYRNYSEIMCSGHPVYGGEWVNTHHEWLEAREAQVEKRLLTLAQELPNNVRMELQGDPRGYLVRLIVTDETGIERTVGVD